MHRDDDVGCECVLGADRFAGRSGSSARSSIARDLIVPEPRLSEMLLQEGERPLLEIGTGLDAERFHLRGCRRTDTVKFLDGQSLHEGGPVAWRDDELAIWLVLVGCHLGEKFVVRDAAEAVRPVTSRIFALIISAIVVADAMLSRFCVTSR